MNFITDKSPTFYLERAKSRLIDAIDEVHLSWSIFSIDDYYDYTDYVLVPTNRTRPGEVLSLFSVAVDSMLSSIHEDNFTDDRLELLKLSWKDIIRKGTFLPVRMQVSYDQVNRIIKIRLTYDKKIYYHEKAACDVQAILDEKV